MIAFGAPTTTPIPREMLRDRQFDHEAEQKENYRHSTCYLFLDLNPHSPSLHIVFATRL